MEECDKEERDGMCQRRHNGDLHACDARGFLGNRSSDAQEDPQEVEETDLQGLQGVYSKLQVWKVFDEMPHKWGTVFFLDIDMLVRANLDEKTNTMKNS